MVYSYIFALFLIGGNAAWASLFLTPEEKSQALSHIPTPKKHIASSLQLQAILHRPDLNEWVVWINGQRIDSRYPQSIEGYTIISVAFDHVMVRSMEGEELRLRLNLPQQNTRREVDTSTDPEPNDPTSAQEHPPEPQSSASQETAS